MKIVLSVALAVFLLGCSDDTQNSQTKEGTVQKVQSSAQKSMDVVKETTNDSVKVVKDTTKEVVESVQETTQKVVQKVQKEAQPVVEEVQKKVEAVVVPSTASVDGEKLYKSTCLACHGMNAEKKALTKSQVIQGWASTKIEDALHGYKNKTYGGAMKTIMEGKAKDLSDDEIKALAGYISKL